MNDTLYIFCLSLAYGALAGVAMASTTILLKTKPVKKAMRFLGLVEEDPLVHTGDGKCELCALIIDSSKDESFQHQVSEQIDAQLTGIEFDNLDRMEVTITSTYFNDGHQFLTQISDPDLALDAALTITIPADPHQPNISHFKITRCENVPEPLAMVLMGQALKHFESDVQAIWINAVYTVLADHGYKVKESAHE